MTIEKGLKLLEALAEPCTVLPIHAWRECPHCLACEAIDTREGKQRIAVVLVALRELVAHDGR